MGRVTITLADLPDNTVNVGIDFINSNGEPGTENASIAHRLGAYLLHCANNIDNEEDSGDEAAGD